MDALRNTLSRLHTRKFVYGKEKETLREKSNLVKYELKITS